MIAPRAARSIDAAAIVALIEARVPDSRYNGIAKVDLLVARRLFAQAAQRHGGKTDGSTFLMVVDGADGEIDAFMLGGLGRVYGIFDQLAASDYFLIGRKGCAPRAMAALLDSYIAWADANPRVIEIGLSWADTIPGSEAVMDAYQRRGFTLTSKAFRRDARADVAKDIAA